MIPAPKMAITTLFMGWSCLQMMTQQPIESSSVVSGQSVSCLYIALNGGTECRGNGPDLLALPFHPVVFRVLKPFGGA